MQQQTTPQIGERQFEIRHRNPLAREYVIVSRVVLIGYPGVSDGAKISYWVIYSHDWYEASTGARKGYAFPTVARMANLRHTSERTIQRHLTELIDAHLLTREFRPGKPSFLYIEEPSNEEIDRYLEQQNSGGDKSVGGGVTKMSPPYETDKAKQEKPINGVQEEFMERRARSSTGLQPLGQIIKPRLASKNAEVRSVDWVAEEIIKSTGDESSVGCYRAIAGHCPEDLIFEALALLKEARGGGTMLRSRGGFFVTAVRRLCERRGLPDPLPPRMAGGRHGTPGPQAGEQPRKRVHTDESTYFPTSDPGAVFGGSRPPRGTFPAEDRSSVLDRSPDGQSNNHDIRVRN